MLALYPYLSSSKHHHRHPHAVGIRFGIFWWITVESILINIDCAENDIGAQHGVISRLSLSVATLEYRYSCTILLWLLWASISSEINKYCFVYLVYLFVKYLWIYKKKCCYRCILQLADTVNSVNKEIQQSKHLPLHEPLQ